MKRHHIKALKSSIETQLELIDELELYIFGVEFLVEVDRFSDEEITYYLDITDHKKDVFINSETHSINDLCDVIIGFLSSYTSGLKTMLDEQKEAFENLLPSQHKLSFFEPISGLIYYIEHENGIYKYWSSSQDVTINYTKKDIDNFTSASKRIYDSFCDYVNSKFECAEFV